MPPPLQKTERLLGRPLTLKEEGGVEVAEPSAPATLLRAAGEMAARAAARALALTLGVETLALQR